MLRKAYTPLSLALEALVLLVVGILLFVDPEGSLVLLVSLLTVYLWVVGIVTVVRWIFKRGENRPSPWMTGPTASAATI